MYKGELSLVSLAIKDNAYIHPELPLANIYFYTDSKTNAIYEEDENEFI